MIWAECVVLENFVSIWSASISNSLFVLITVALVLITLQLLTILLLIDAGDEQENSKEDEKN